MPIYISRREFTTQSRACWPTRESGRGRRQSIQERRRQASAGTPTFVIGEFPDNQAATSAVLAAPEGRAFPT